MNSTFKVVFNKARGALMVVNEVTSSVQAKGTKTVIATAVAAMIAGVAGTAAAADPVKITESKVFDTAQTVTETTLNTGSTNAVVRIDGQLSSKTEGETPVAVPVVVEYSKGLTVNVEADSSNAAATKGQHGAGLRVQNSTVTVNEGLNITASAIGANAGGNSALNGIYVQTKAGVYNSATKLTVNGDTVINVSSKEAEKPTTNSVPLQVTGISLQTVGNAVAGEKASANLEVNGKSLTINASSDANTATGIGVSFSKAAPGVITVNSEKTVLNIEGVKRADFNNLNYVEPAITTADAPAVGLASEGGHIYINGDLEATVVDATKYTEDKPYTQTNTTYEATDDFKRADSAVGIFAYDNSQTGSYGPDAASAKIVLAGNVDLTVKAAEGEYAKEAKSIGVLTVKTNNGTTSVDVIFGKEGVTESDKVYNILADRAFVGNGNITLNNGKLNLGGTDEEGNKYAGTVNEFTGNYVQNGGSLELTKDNKFFGGNVEINGGAFAAETATVATGMNITVNGGAATFGTLDLTNASLTTGQIVKVEEYLVEGKKNYNVVDGEAVNGVVADNAIFEGATVTLGINNNVKVNDTLTLAGDNTLSQAVVTSPVKKADGSTIDFSTVEVPTVVAKKTEGVATLTAGTIKVATTGASLAAGVDVSATNLDLVATAPTQNKPEGSDAALTLTGGKTVSVANDIVIAGIAGQTSATDRTVGLTIEMDAVPDAEGKDRVYNFVAEKGIAVGNLGTLTLTKGNVKVGENLTVAKDGVVASTAGKLDIGGTLDIAKGAEVGLAGVTVTADKLVNAAGTSSGAVTLGNVTVANGGSNTGYLAITGGTIGGTFDNKFIAAETEDDEDVVGNISAQNLTVAKNGVFNNAGELEATTKLTLDKYAEFNNTGVTTTAELDLQEGAVFNTALKGNEDEIVPVDLNAKAQKPAEVKSYTTATTVKVGKDAIFNIAEKNHWSVTRVEVAAGAETPVQNYTFAQDGIQLDGTWNLNGGTITLAGESIANEDVWVNGNLTIQNGSDVEVNRLNIAEAGSVTVGVDGELTFNNAFGIDDTTYKIGYKNPDDEEGHAVADTAFKGLAGNNGIVYVTIENKNALDFEEIVAGGSLGAAGTAISTKFGLTGDNKGLVFVEGLKVKAPEKNEITQNQAGALGGLVIEGLDGLTVTGVVDDAELKGSFGNLVTAAGQEDVEIKVDGILVLNGSGALIADKDGELNGGLDLNDGKFIFEGEADAAAEIGAITNSGADPLKTAAVEVATGALTVQGGVTADNLFVGDDSVAEEVDVGALTVNGDVAVKGAEVDAGSKLAVNGNVVANTIVANGDVVVNTAADAEEAATVTANAVSIDGGSITTGKDVALNVADAIEVADGKLNVGDVNVSGYWVVTAINRDGSLAENPTLAHELDAEVANSYGSGYQVDFVAGEVSLNNTDAVVADLTVVDGDVDLVNGTLTAASVTAESVAANGTTVTVEGAVNATEVDGINATISAGSVAADTVTVQNGSLNVDDTVEVGSLNVVNAATEVGALTAETATIAAGSLVAEEVTVGQATLVGTTAQIGTLNGNVNVGRDDFKADLAVTNFASGTIFSDPAFGESGKLAFADANNVAIGTVGGFAHLARGTVAVIGQGTMEGVGEKLASVGITELEQNKYDAALVVVGGTTNTGSVRLDNATELGSSTGALVTSATTALVIDGASFAEAPALFEEGNVELNGVTYITDAKAGTTIQLTGNGQILGNGAINTDVNRVFNADKEGGALVVNVKNDMGVLEDLVAIDAVKSYYGEAYGNGGNAAFVEGMLGNANTMTDREIVQAMNDVAGIGATAGMASVTMDALSAFNDTVAQRTSILAANAEGTTVWADVNGGKYEAKKLMNGAGYTSDIYAGVIGVDTVVSCGAKIGAALTVGTGDTDSKNTTAATTMDSDFFGLSVYTAKQFGDVNVAVDLGYMQGSNDVSVKAYGLNKFSADTDALTIGIRGEVLAKVGSFNLVPHAGLRWTKLSVDSFEAGYKTDIDDLNVFQLPVGVTVAGEFEGAGFTWAPAFDLSFVPAFGDKDADMTLGIAGASQTSAYGVQVIDSNPVQATLGIDATNGAWAFGLNYKLGVGTDSRMNNSFNANVRFTF